MFLPKTNLLKLVLRETLLYRLQHFTAKIFSTSVCPSDTSHTRAIPRVSNENLNSFRFVSLWLLEVPCRIYGHLVFSTWTNLA